MFQAPRGTADILPADQDHWRFFRARAEETAFRFGYGRIDTPVFEDARLFERGVGQVTDIVEKETYTFQDRGGDLLTLRPEGTAPVCRAYLEHGMHNLPQPVRLYYIFPGFRYERPQSGRYRQHHQFGVEMLGDADASADAEVIELGWRFLESIGLRELSLWVNSIGAAQCRPPYVEELKAYYRPRGGPTLRRLPAKAGGEPPASAGLQAGVVSTGRGRRPLTASTTSATTARPTGRA